MSIKVNVFTFNALQENTYIVSDETNECVIIDPGCADKAERQELEFFIKQNNLKPVQLLNTHCHIDHVLGNAFVKQTYKLKLSIHPVETETLRSVKLYAAMYGYPNYEETEAEIFIQEGEKITFGNSVLDILFVPGHAPGHIAFIDFASKQVFAGDVIFKQSIGRTDLLGGNFKQLKHSIRTKLYALADDFVVYCGHGPKTTIGMEKKMGYFRA
ncbi:MAG: MBL fold metallo-hydrolase [Bacteroidetes bacterium]|nr:MAG: MBL fold metallo-hydrolase [Bacteroidota bacterium]